jgi:hypothetical protein
MTPRDALEALLERVTTLTEGSRDIDADLRRLVHGLPASVSQLWTDIPPYTESIDAALALTQRLLPGWAVGFDAGPKTIIAFVDPHDHADRFLGARHTAEGATPALAIIGATLRALIAKGEAE